MHYIFETVQGYTARAPLASQHAALVSLCHCNFLSSEAPRSRTHDACMKMNARLLTSRLFRAESQISETRSFQQTFHVQGYQSFTQALGVLEVKEARDAFLSSLCSFALSSKMAEDADLDLPLSPALVASSSGDNHCDCCCC